MLSEKKIIHEKTYLERGLDLQEQLKNESEIRSGDLLFRRKTFKALREEAERLSSPLSLKRRQRIPYRDEKKRRSMPLDKGVRRDLEKNG